MVPSVQSAMAIDYVERATFKISNLLKCYQATASKAYLSIQTLCTINIGESIV